jgi:hypothetical protein
VPVPVGSESSLMPRHRGPKARADPEAARAAAGAALLKSLFLRAATVPSQPADSPVASLSHGVPALAVPRRLRPGGRSAAAAASLSRKVDRRLTVALAIPSRQLS